MAQQTDLERDILAQPGAFRELARTGPDRWEAGLEAMARLPGPAAGTGPSRGADGANAGGAGQGGAAPPPGRTLLVGMGSSYMAACGAARSWSSWGVPATAELASDLLHYGRGRIGPQDRVILISQSGASVELVKLAHELAAREVPLVALTNRAESPLGEMAQALFTMELPPDHGVAIKSFGGTLLTLLYLGRRLAGGAAAEWAGPAREVADALAAFMDAAAGWHDLGRQFGGLPHRMGYVTLARGPAVAGARESALLGNEVAKVPAWFEEGGEFRHGIIELCEPDFLAGVLIPEGPGAQLQVALAQEIAATGAPVLATAPAGWAQALRETGARVLTTPDLPEDYAAPVHTLPYQWLTLGWAEGRGVTPGQFRYIPGVITDEGTGRPSR